ncbi:hypothetical protein RJ55_05857 [Drechmeria coniospora]|nr:hypothetical protein RJ55_05857 [Drechmeria coniospora]
MFGGASPSTQRYRANVDHTHVAGLLVNQPVSVMRENNQAAAVMRPSPSPVTESLPYGHDALQLGLGLTSGSYWGPEQCPHSSYSVGQVEKFLPPGPIRYHTSNCSPSTILGSPHRSADSVTSNVDASSWVLDHPRLLPAAEAAGQPGFKEMALAHAKTSYVDLLAFLRSDGRPTAPQVSPGRGVPDDVLAYPRPSPSVIFEPGAPNLAEHICLDRVIGCARPSQQVAPDHHVVAVTSSQRGAELYSSNHMAAFVSGTQSQIADASPLAISSSVIESAKSSLDVLNNLCEHSDWRWLEGLLLGGCLHYGLENYEDALSWFARILHFDPRHVEAVTNFAATLYCLNREQDAENHWLNAVTLCPGYLDATEHLLGLLYKSRGEEAVRIIAYVQQALKLPSTAASQLSLTENEGFGSSGYALPGRENGRMLALVHAKATMQYNLKELDNAAESFEEAVLIGAGRRFGGIQDLIERVHTVLSSESPSTGSRDEKRQPLCPLMLPPESALDTARRVFPGRGELPGLHFVRDVHSKQAAIQTTSNSLLSLAKIFQDTMSKSGGDHAMIQNLPGVGDILCLYYLSFSLQESPSTANNVGILLAGVQQHALCTSASWSSNHAATPNIPGASHRSGTALAFSYYNYGLRLDSKHVHLHTNLGSLMKDVGHLDLAIQMYERAVMCDGSFEIALTNLANAVKDRGDINEAVEYYRRAISSNPEFTEAVCGLLTALNSICNWRGRGGVVLESGKYDRWHVDDEGRLIDARTSGTSCGLIKQVVDIVTQQIEDASYWGRHTLREPVITALATELQHLCHKFDLDCAIRQWAGKPWEGSRALRLIERATRLILRKWYLERRHATGRQSEGPYFRPRLPPGLNVPAAPTVLPFHTFTCPLTAKVIRTISQRNAMRISCATLRSPWLPCTVYPPPAPPDPHLNVGYVSSDFNNHPLAHLMQSVFGLHNPDRVRAFCYATSSSDGSTHRRKIEKEAPVFRDVSHWPSDKLIDQIIQDQIHILVNLNGYTRGARNEIFAARPCPVQISFMGFAGSLGAEWCDYLLADKTAIPLCTLRPWRDNMTIEGVFHDNNEGDDGGWMYSENIIFCRNSFFCCDHAQSCESHERRMSWDEEQRQRWAIRREIFPAVADDIVILGNFNQLYKIDPTTFRSWLRILAGVPNAVLWLLRFPESGESNLRATAKAWAGAEVASRLIFTDVAPKNQHLSRARACDLFLDTPECNAHTTAADVLWSSTPLLTLPRYPFKMCSRMATSILRGALPTSAEGSQAARELTAENESEYEETAISLASGLTYVQLDELDYAEGRGRLAEMRKLLWHSKWQCGLFNTGRWVNDVETAYEEAWRRWVEGVGGDIYL